MGNTKIKICGITRICEINWLNEIEPDYAGFVFGKSRRRITLEELQIFRKFLNPKIKAVGVFVNAAPNLVADLLEEGLLDLAQLHGTETPEEIEMLKRRTDKPVIKAVSVKSAEDIRDAQRYPVDYLLYDRGTGGTGESFDWDLVEQCENKKLPFFLAGGIDSGNVKEAIEKLHPYAVDVSSSVESMGKKDREKLLEFVRSVRNAERKIR